MLELVRGMVREITRPTVRSDRRGIAPDVAPAEVLAILDQDELPPACLSPPSGVNYAVMLVGEKVHRIGVVHLGQGVGDERVLVEYSTQIPHNT